MQLPATRFFIILTLLFSTSLQAICQDSLFISQLKQSHNLKAFMKPDFAASDVVVIISFSPLSITLSPEPCALCPELYIEFIAKSKTNGFAM